MSTVIKYNNDTLSQNFVDIRNDPTLAGSCLAQKLT